MQFDNQSTSHTRVIKVSGLVNHSDVLIQVSLVESNGYNAVALDGQIIPAIMSIFQENKETRLEQKRLAQMNALVADLRDALDSKVPPSNQLRTIEEITDDMEYALSVDFKGD